MGLRRYNPPRGSWSELSWPAWLLAATVLIGLSLLAGFYISAGILGVIVAFVALLRLRIGHEPPNAE